MTLHAHPSTDRDQPLSYGWPTPRGLYDPAAEHESCGVGFIAHIKGHRSHQIVRDAILALINMDHRGGCGCEANTGDGAGLLTALPHEFLAKVVQRDFARDLPPAGRYAAGLVFLPTDEAQRRHCRSVVEALIAEQGQRLLGWRKVPQETVKADIGPAARAAEPFIEMLIVEAGPGFDGDRFERQLYVIRKRASHALRGDASLPQGKMFYVCSLSTKVIIYKGMLTPAQVPVYFPDLADPDYTSHLAMLHSRFSTNTFPSWDRAQPMRFMSHNGEINTLRGNVNWMHAREGVVHSELLGKDLPKLFPIIEADTSDSGNFDNALELLLMSGRTLQEGVMMMIPEAWQNHESMPEDRRAFYEYHACLMEPWDGPASIAFTDGHYIGAVLDRNGLRPSRYYLTHDDRVVMASEVGVVPSITPDMIKEKGRLQPGRVFLIDFEQGRMVPDEEIKHAASKARPYARWVREQRLDIEALCTGSEPHGFDPDTLLQRMQAFGYSGETMQFMLLPMVQEKRDPVGSMGNDAALAVLSDQPRLIYDYFKQLFAQVTNPPIDSIREEVIMSLECCIGPEGNLLESTPKHAHRLRLPGPIISNEELVALKRIDKNRKGRGWRTRVIDITFPRAEGRPGLRQALDRVAREAELAIDQGCQLVVLSDRAAGPERVPVSALLATGAVHHHLIRRTKRTRIGIVVETGEAREVHHHCLLVGFGADAVNPYLAFEALWDARQQGLLDKDMTDDGEVVYAYRKAVNKGLLKVMAKMGISTLQSYKGAQIFEAVGLADEVMQVCFAGTASRISGVGFEVLAEEALRRHGIGFPERDQVRLPVLPNLGEFHWRADGERHMWDPQAISDLQAAVRAWAHPANDPAKRRNGYQSASTEIDPASWKKYLEYARHANEDARTRCALRGLLKLKPASQAVPLDEVEPASAIVRRFVTGAMSFGSISAESHETLAVAMNRIGGKSNTGEGGEEPERYPPLPNGDSKRSAIKQVASGRFGVNIHYLTQADELQIKMAQGAKPGEGGELPGRKVDERIARVRFSTPGVGLISPPPHHDIYSIEDLAQLIHDLKNSNPAARVSVKLVSEVGVGTIAAGVAKAHADHILISGDTGGTGASPLTSIKHAGLPWELGIAETHQTLVLNDLRSRVVLQTDGQIKTGRDVAIAFLLGAEEVGMSTGPLVSLGCIMMRKCHLNTCPVGIATQDPVLRRKFAGKPEHVVNYMFLVAEECRQHMAALGFRTVHEMIGRTDRLQTDDAIRHWKAQGLDLAPILVPARGPQGRQVDVYCTMKQDHGLERALDNTHLLKLCEPALRLGQPVRAELPILNTHRTVGTILSHELTKRYGADGLPDGTIQIRLVGSAGQSLGAFLAKGVTLEVEGDCNDYVGKGLSGGRVVVYPPRNAGFVAEHNMIVGNVCLYGAIAGDAFFRGRAAERFCVRNSGARAVVEGVGDHGCEYMTGGRAVILGPTGRNFAAGMSGGIAYVWDPEGDFLTRCNLGTVELEKIQDEDDVAELLSLIGQHSALTGSTVAAAMLDQWPNCLDQFVKVMPVDYKRVLMDRKKHDEEIEANLHSDAEVGA